MKQCTCCGSAIEDGDNICPVCGMPVAPQAVSVENPQPEVPQAAPVENLQPEVPQAAPVENPQPGVAQAAPVENPQPTAVDYQQYQQYSQTEYQQTAVEGKAKRPRAAVAALVLGILAILTSCAFGIGAVFGIIAIILAIVAGKKQKEKDGVRTTGLVLGIVGTVISFFGLIIGIAAIVPTMSKYTQKAQKSTDIMTAQTLQTAIHTSLAMEEVYDDMSYYSGETYSLSEDYVYLPQSFQDEVNAMLGENAETLKPKYTGDDITGFSFYIDTYNCSVIVYASTDYDKRAYELTPNTDYDYLGY